MKFKVFMFFGVLLMLAMSSCSYWKFHYRQQYPINFPDKAPPATSIDKKNTSRC